MRNDIHHLFLLGHYCNNAYRESHRQDKTPQNVCRRVRAHGSKAEAVFGVLPIPKGNKKMTAGVGAPNGQKKRNIGFCV